MWSSLVQPDNAPNDGWEDEDDDEDFTEEADTEGSSSHHDRNNDSPSPRPGGLFMGRLTQFLEQVTHPEANDIEEDETGWDEEEEDDDDLLEESEQPSPQDGVVSLGLDNNHDDNAPRQEKDDNEGWDEDDKLLGDLSSPEQPSTVNDEGLTAQPPLAMPAGDGWDNDDLDFSSERQPPFVAADHSLNLGAPIHLVSPPPPPSNQVEEGWDDDDDDDDNLNLLSEEPSTAVVEENVAQAEQSLQTVLKEIDQQEESVVPKPTAEDRNFSSDDMSQDERDAEQAVRKIQKEMEDIVEENIQDNAAVVVDQTPHVLPKEPPRLSSEDPSLKALAMSEDLSRDTGQLSNNVVYDDENEMEYGPVVDHTPRKLLDEPQRFSRQNSLAVQVDDANVKDDIEQDDAMDESVLDDGWEDDVDVALDDDDDDDEDVLEQQEENASEPIVVDQLPRDDDDDGPRRATDSSVQPLLPSEGEASVNFEEEDDDEKDDAHAFGPVVDHTPTTPAAVAPTSGAISMAVHASALQEDFDEDDAMDETYDGGGGGASTDGARTPDNVSTEGGWEEDDVILDDDDDDGVESSEPVSSQLEARIAVTKSKGEKVVVDHTPAEMSDEAPPAEDDPSLAVLATTEDRTRDTGEGNDEALNDEEVFDDENELDYRPVVDHLPQTPAASTVVSRANSMVVHASALSEDIEQDEAMDETVDGDSTGDTGTSEGGADGWEHDDEILDDGEVERRSSLKGERKQPPKARNVTLVDHTPSEMGSPAPQNSDPSVSVLPSEGDTKDDADDDDESDNAQQFGPVVDHLPPTPAPSTQASRSYSILTQVPMQELENESATLEGGSTVDAGPSTLDAGESTVDDDDRSEAVDEMPSDLRSPEDQLVDRVPQRPESRFGDASTLVAADPSEILSEVDDINQEEGNYGPVVDLTPPTRSTSAQAEPPSGAGSTEVFVPPSVAADDLDGADETEVSGEDDGWDHDDPEIEESPNPQSGNDEPAPERVNEQLVDFLPPQDEDADGSREASVESQEDFSEVAVGGAQSLQPEDPKEDDFGPVVDHTPAPRSSSLPSSAISNASIATQLTASECRAMEREDNAEESCNSINENKSKVVVDHLPSQIPGKNQADSTATIAQSQLSEDEEDLSRFGPVVDHLPTSRSSIAPSRGGSTVDALATVSEVDSDGDGDGWDDASESGVSDRGTQHTATSSKAAFRRSPSTASEHERSVSVRFESIVDKTSPLGASISSSQNATKFFDAEMNEASLQNETQFYDPEMNEPCGWDDDIAIEDENLDLKPAAKVMYNASFAEADTPPSTPYRRDESGVIERSENNFGEQLQERLKTDASQQWCETCANSKTIDCPCVQRLLDISDDKGSLVGRVITPEGDTIQIDLGKLLQEEITMRRLVEEESKALQGLEQPLITAKESEQDLEIFELRKSNERLLEEMESLQNQCAGLRDHEKKLEEDLAASSSQVEMLESAQGAWSAKESAFEAEIQQLKASLDESALKIASDADIAETMSDMQSELASKTGECERLCSQMTQLQELLEDAEARSAEQAKELKEHSTKLEQDVARLGAELQSSSQRTHEANQSRETAQAEARRHIQDIETRSEKLRAEKESVSKKVIDLQLQHEEELQQQYKLLDKKTADIRALEMSLKTLEKDKATLSEDLSRQRSLAEESESLACELLSVAKERDLLQEALIESKEAVCSLQKLIDEHGMEREALESKRELENTALKTELNDIKSIVTSKDKEIDALVSKIDAETKEKGSLTKEIEESRMSIRSLESAAEYAKLRATKEEAKAAEVQKEVQSLRQELSHLSNERERDEAERQSMVLQLTELGQRLEHAESETHAEAQRAAELEAQLNDTQSRADSRELEIASLKTELNGIISTLASKDKELRDLLSKLGASEKEKDSFARQLEESWSACRSLESAAEHAKVSRAKEEAKTAKMEKEIQSLRDHISQVSSDRERAEAERQSLASQLTELGQVLQRAENDSNTHAQMATQLETQLNDVRRNADSLRNERNMMASEKAQLEKKCAETEQRLSSLIDTAKKQAGQQIENQKREISRLKQEHDRLQQQLEEQEIVSEQLEQQREQLRAVTEERDSLAEENEEMLVQFGLLKEDMDASEAEARRLTDVIDELRSAGAEMNGERSIELESLVEDNKSLTAKIRELTSSKSAMDAQNKALAQERDDLAARFRSLETANIDACASANEVEDLRSMVEKLETRCQELKDQCQKQQDEIDRVEEQPRDLGMDEDLSQLRDEVRRLQSECDEKQQTIAWKDSELRELQDMLQGTGGKTNRALDDLRKKLRKMEQESLKSSRRISELEEMNEETKAELDLTKEQLSATEASLKAKEDLATFEDAVHQLGLKAGSSAAQVADVVAEYEDRLKELEEELTEKKITVTKLEESVASLQFQLSAANSAAFQAGSGHGSMGSIGVTDLLTSSGNSEIQNMRTQLESLESALQSTRARLGAKEEEVDRLTSELRALESRQNEEAKNVSRALASPETVDDIDSLRTHVVSLAVALERSENRRAEAIDRLLTERQVNADSLRRLSESVKRFYSTVSFGDS